MTVTGHPVGNYFCHLQCLTVPGQPQGHRPEGLGHPPGINHRNRRYPRQHRQIGTGRRAIKQAHGPFHQNQVCLAGRLGQPPAAFIFTGHPGLQLIDRRPAGYLQHHGVQIVRTKFEHLHTPAGVSMQPCQRRRHQRFSLSRPRRANEGSRDRCLKSGSGGSRGHHRGLCHAGTNTGLPFTVNTDRL